MLLIQIIAGQIGIFHSGESSNDTHQWRHVALAFRYDQAQLHAGVSRC